MRYYAKLEGEIMRRAPYMLFIDGLEVWYPTDEQYLEHGYKPVTFTDEPEAPEGYYYEPGWEEQTDAIVQTWTLKEQTDDVDEAEAWEIVFGGAE